MSARSHVVLAGGGVLALALAWWFLRTTPLMPRVLDVALQPGAPVNREKLQRFDLAFKGVPFGSSVHELKNGEEFRLTSDTRVHRDRLPSESAFYYLRVNWRPKGARETDWVDWDSRTWVIPLGKNDPFNSKVKIDPKVFQPGEYEMRAYLKIVDLEGENNSLDYLGSAQLRVMP